jgi:hypothetical protein
LMALEPTRSARRLEEARLPRAGLPARRASRRNLNWSVRRSQSWGEGRTKDQCSPAATKRSQTDQNDRLAQIWQPNPHGRARGTRPSRRWLRTQFSPSPGRP